MRKPARGGRHSEVTWHNPSSATTFTLSSALATTARSLLARARTISGPTLPGSRRTSEPNRHATADAGGAAGATHRRGRRKRPPLFPGRPERKHYPTINAAHPIARAGSAGLRFPRSYPRSPTLRTSGSRLRSPRCGPRGGARCGEQEHERERCEQEGLVFHFYLLLLAGRTGEVRGTGVVSGARGTW